MTVIISTETTGKINARSGDKGRVWYADREPDVVSLAVTGDRLKLTPTEARSLARTLTAFADAVERHNPAGTTARPFAEPHTPHAWR